MTRRDRRPIKERVDRVSNSILTGGIRQGARTDSRMDGWMGDGERGQDEMAATLGRTVRGSQGEAGTRLARADGHRSRGHSPKDDLVRVYGGTQLCHRFPPQVFHVPLTCHAPFVDSYNT